MQLRIKFKMKNLRFVLLVGEKCERVRNKIKSIIIKMMPKCLCALGFHVTCERLVNGSICVQMKLFWYFTQNFIIKLSKVK